MGEKGALKATACQRPSLGIVEHFRGVLVQCCVQAQGLETGGHLQMVFQNGVEGTHSIKNNLWGGVEGLSSCECRHLS